MDTNIIHKKKWSAKLIALLLTSALVAGVFAFNLGKTIAAPSDLVVTLQNERSEITPDMHIEVGTTRSYQVAYLNEAKSSDTATATVTYTSYVPGSTNINGVMSIKGEKTGLANLAFGNRLGLVSAFQYLIVDSNNVSAYKIKEGGEMYFSVPASTTSGVAKPSPVTVTVGQFDRITWSSTNEKVATVASSGAITPVSKGVTLVIGTFTDKWGVPRDLHILVSVGVYLGPDNRLGELLELIKRGEDKLAEKDSNNQSPYSEESRQALQTAVNEGKNVVNNESRTDSQVNTAITNLENAINNLKERLGSGVIKGDDGNYYKEVPGQPNVYEEVKKDGSSKYNPPRFVWGGHDKKPGTSDDRPAEVSQGGYFVEDPANSNIWKPVDSTGNLTETGMIWGGYDGKPGGEDDINAKKFGDNYWVHMGQNVWRKVEGPKRLGQLTGGGLTSNPQDYQVIPIFDNLLRDGKYYVGPLGPDSTGLKYYYGDPPYGGNGKLESTASAPLGDDVKYYLDANGVMVREDPSVVTTVTVNPSTITMVKGSSFSFSATAIQRDGAASPAGVTWSVSPTTGGSSISSSGVLTVGVSETAATLTVTATSVKTPTVSGTATVTVASIANPTDIRNVEISPLSATVVKGNSFTFSAKVFRYNNTEDNPGVTWSLSPTSGGSTINQNGVVTVAPGETNTLLTVTATSKTNPAIFATVTVTVIANPDDGSGVPGLNATPKGGTITIDGIEWMKVSDDRVSSNGVTYSLLIMKGVLKDVNGVPIQTTYCANEMDYYSGYQKSDVCKIINGWYYNTNMPTLKRYALAPRLYWANGPGTFGPNYCFGEPAPTGPTDCVAFPPHRDDVWPTLATQELQNGYLWWTMTMEYIESGAHRGSLVVLMFDGTWGRKSRLDTTTYVRPCIFVKRGNS